MPDAPSVAQLVQAGMAGAAVVFFGGLYALFLAWYRMGGRPGHRLLACLSYVALAISFFVLAHALALDSLWLSFVALLLLAYLFAPHWIWQLSRATHAEHVDRDSEQNSATRINEETGV